MTDQTGEFPTVLGTDAKFNGELTFDKSVRIEGTFEGRIRSKGSLTIAEGAKVVADVDAANVCLEGECKGNVVVSEKLQLMATARLEGDLRTTRLEIADGAIFVGNVTVGQSAAEAGARKASHAHDETATTSHAREAGRGAAPQPVRPRPQQVSTA